MSADAPLNGYRTEEPNIGEQLGLGQHFAPQIVPMSWNALKGRASPEDVIILRLATPVGVLGFTFTESDFRNFVASCQSALSGLVIPT